MSVYAFSYDLDTLREKINLVLARYGAGMVTGTPSATAHTINVTKTALFSLIDKYIQQSVKLDPAASSISQSAIYIYTNVIEEIDRIIKDNVSPSGASSYTPSNITFTITDLLSIIESYIKSSPKAYNSNAVSLVYTHSTLLNEIELRVQDHAVKSGTVGSVSISVTETDVYVRAKRMTAQAGMRQEIPDNYTLTDDELTTMKAYLDEGIQELSKYTDQIGSSFSLSTGVWAIGFTNLPSIYTAILTEYINGYLANYIAKKWYSVNGNIEFAKTHDEKVTFFIKELDTILVRKTESFEIFLKEAFYMVEQRLNPITSAAYAYVSATSHTLALSASHGLNTSGIGSLTTTINKLVVQYAADKWLLKLNQPAKFNPDFSEIDEFTQEKYNSILNYCYEINAKISAKISRISGSNISFVSPTFTLTIAQSYNFTSKTIEHLKSDIKELVAKYATNMWLIKTGGQPIFQDANTDILDRYINEKYESVKQSMDNSVNYLVSLLEPLSASHSHPDAYSVQLTFVHNGVATSSTNALTGLTGKYLYYKTAQEWINKLGLQIDLSPKIAELHNELLKYTENKYDVFNSSLSLRVNDILSVIKYITTTTFTNTTAVTFTIANDGNFDNQTVQNITNAINAYLANIIAYDWLVRMSNQSAVVYGNAAKAQLELLSSLTERKRDEIDIILKRAAYKVYANWQFAGKDMEKPVLYDEEYTWSDDQTLNDGGTEDFVLSAATVDADGLIYYRLLLNVSWPESNEESLIEQIEEALINFTLKEYVKDKPKLLEFYPIHNSNYEDNVADVRINLFTRLKGKAVRRNSDWL